jgi:hypothetical protein
MSFWPALVHLRMYQVQGQEMRTLHSQSIRAEEKQYTEQVRTRPFTPSVTFISRSRPCRIVLPLTGSQWTDLKWNSFLYMRADVPLDADQSPASTDMHASPP